MVKTRVQRKRTTTGDTLFCQEVFCISMKPNVIPKPTFICMHSLLCTNDLVSIYKKYGAFLEKSLKPYKRLDVFHLVLCDVLIFVL